MAGGYDNFADAMLAAINGPKETTDFQGEEWEPLQCIGCEQWFPVLKRAVDAMPGTILKMECEGCKAA